MSPRDRLLERFDPGRRDFLRTVILASAYAAPFVASFSLDGLAVPGVAAANLCSNATSTSGTADLTISKTGPTGPFHAGDLVTFQIQVANCGPSPAANAVFQDDLRLGAAFQSITQTSGPTFTLSLPPVGGNGVLQGTIASFAAGAVATFDLVVQVQ